MKKSLTVVYSSHLSEKHNEEFNQHVIDTIGVDHKIISYPNFNQYSLTEIYNKAIKEHHNDEAIMVFCHNDIVFDTKDWGKKLLNHFNKNDYQIIGVAGATELNSHGCWWLSKSNQMNFSKMMGIVNHDNGLRKWESKYSNPHFGVKPVVLVDGVFIAVDTSDIEATFDETYKGFHLYDVSFCFPNYLAGCNIGVVTDIRLTHKSIGMTNDQWENNRLQFANQYASDLPADINDSYE